MENKIINTPTPEGVLYSNSIGKLSFGDEELYEWVVDSMEEYKNLHVELVKSELNEKSSLNRFISTDIAAIKQRKIERLERKIEYLENQLSKIK